MELWSRKNYFLLILFQNVFRIPFRGFVWEVRNSCKIIWCVFLRHRTLQKTPSNLQHTFVCFQFSDPQPHGNCLNFTSVQHSGPAPIVLAWNNGSVPHPVPPVESGAGRGTESDPAPGCSHYRSARPTLPIFSAAKESTNNYSIYLIPEFIWTKNRDIWTKLWIFSPNIDQL